MDQRRTIIWCRAHGRSVQVVLERAGEEQPIVHGIPDGWRITRCLDETFDCVGKECPFPIGREELRSRRPAADQRKG